ncbi:MULTISPECIES: hypothetical protein [unclassified Calothrix]|nr:MULTISPECIES: hypothetical protein [unclassified Calothrix]
MLALQIYWVFKKSDVPSAIALLKLSKISWGIPPASEPPLAV